MTTNPEWYVPKPPDLGRETRKYIKTTGKSLAQVDADGPHVILGIKGLGAGTVMQIGRDLHRHGLIGWHWAWKDKEWKPGPRPEED